jgi:hypothetical protein
VIPFDKNGVCTGPRTLDGLVRAAQDATDVFLFSHGWNEDWSAATRRYDEFAASYVDVRHREWSPPTRNYRPVLVGVFWPSAALVLPSEEAPDIAGGPEPAPPQPDFEDITALAESLPPDRAARFYELAQRDALDRDEATEFAALLVPALAGVDDELDQDATAPQAADLVDVWAQLPADAGGDGGPRDLGGFIDDGPGQPGGAGPAVGGLLDILDPRNIVRVATVLLMKDRAGHVGGTGVAAMLRRLVDASPDSRLHLVGHSYGCKVVLSALCNGPAPGRPVESVLLLQPALSCLCFATDADGKGHAGGYRAALERTRQPIMTTFSSHDIPLTQLFHWAVRRASDLGEAVIAGAPPSRYAALGGFGPQGAGADVVTVTAKREPDRYDVTAAGRRIVAVQADATIGGHGDVTNPATAWSLLCQVMG